MTDDDSIAWEPEPTPKPEVPVVSRSLAQLHNAHVSVEKFRIQTGNRINAIARGVDEQLSPVPDVYQRVMRYAEQMEQALDAEIAEQLKTITIYTTWLQHVKGIGPSLAGAMLGMLIVPQPDKGPSMWYRAAGLAPSPITTTKSDGTTVTLSRLPRPRAGGGKITYHPGLRRTLFLVGKSFVRTGGYYRTAYEQAKARIQHIHAEDPDWPPHRIDSVARWKAVKLFLSHLWEVWSELLGFEPRKPYVIDVLKHQTYIPAPRPQRDAKGKVTQKI